MKKILWRLLSLVLAAFPLTAQSGYKIAQPEGVEAFLPLMKAIYTELGITPVLEVVPAERGLQGTNAGSYDADVGRVGGILGPYPNLMYTSEPIITLDLLAFAKTGSAVAVSSAADLKKYKLAMVRGMKMGETFAAAQGLTVEYVADVPTLVKMLEMGRFDIALTNSVQTGSVKTVGTQVGPKLMTVATYHVMNKKHADLAPKFDAVLKAMKADGRFAKLISGK